MCYKHIVLYYMCMNSFRFTPVFEKIVRKVKLPINLLGKVKNTKNEIPSTAFISTWPLRA